jgi:hypothetical protein
MGGSTLLGGLLGGGSKAGKGKIKLESPWKYTKPAKRVMRRYMKMPMTLPVSFGGTTYNLPTLGPLRAAGMMASAGRPITAAFSGQPAQPSPWSSLGYMGVMLPYLMRQQPNQPVPYMPINPINSFVNQYTSQGNQVPFGVNMPWSS